MRPDTPTPRTNRLIHEASAYLRQHAHNPVDWYPWGDEALQRARDEDRPILLSVGYSACHWCHVMERESFQDERTARLMNDNFVCIKVDREERPDIDQIYQAVVQLMRHSGGWPLTVFLTPQQRPFYAGTYFPPLPRHGMPSFPELLIAIREAYDQKREDVAAQADEITSAVAQVTGARKPGDAGLGPDLLTRACAKLNPRFDSRHGGFGQRPKFPNTMALDVMLRHAVEDHNVAAEARVRRALDAMREGGIWDHLGGGFHRYSTDERWLVPHFEKMLYDNALLMRLYTDAARALGEPRYLDVAREIGAYVRREMQSPQGAFYAAQDADSEGEEGRFFVWTPAQLEATLPDPLTRQILHIHFGLTTEGNFEHTGATVLSYAVPPDEVATRLSLPLDEVLRRLHEGRSALLAAREQREKPFRDEKMLACWNGLMIGALAELGATSGEAQWVEMAARALDCLERHLVDEQGNVARYLSVESGQERVQKAGFLDDHANLAGAALDLFEATGEPRHAQLARRIADRILARFWADDGFYFTPTDGESLIVRTRDPYDQATPSGPAMAALLMLRLGALFDGVYAERAAGSLAPLASAAVDNPLAFGQTVCALHRLVKGSVDVLVVGSAADPRTGALLRTARAAYLPRRMIALVHDEASREAAPALAAGKPPRPDAPAAYVCRGQTCAAPVTTPAELHALLGPEP